MTDFWAVGRIFGKTSVAGGAHLHSDSHRVHEVIKLLILIICRRLWIPVEFLPVVLGNKAKELAGSKWQWPQLIVNDHSDLKTRYQSVGNIQHSHCSGRAGHGVWLSCFKRLLFRRTTTRHRHLQSSHRSNPLIRKHATFTFLSCTLAVIDYLHGGNLALSPHVGLLMLSGVGGRLLAPRWICLLLAVSVR